MTTFRKGSLLIGASVALALWTLPMAADSGKPSDSGFHLDIGADKSADARDVGLPYYPGAWARKDNKDDDSAVNMWAFAGAFGFKLAIAKLGSNDPQGHIADFYRRELARYGQVLDCSRTPRLETRHDNDDKLDCHDDHPAAGEVELKAGSKYEQHVVDIKPAGKGSDIDLVYVSLKGIHD